jgi:hypothetical protein
MLIHIMLEQFIRTRMTGSNWQVSLATILGLHQICDNISPGLSVIDISLAVWWDTDLMDGSQQVSLTYDL